MAQSPEIRIDFIMIGVFGLSSVVGTLGDHMHGDGRCMVGMWCLRRVCVLCACCVLVRGGVCWCVRAMCVHGAREATLEIWTAISYPSMIWPKTGCLEAPGVNQSRLALWLTFMKN